MTEEREAFCKIVKCEFYNELASLKNKCTNEYGLEPFDCMQDPTDEQAKLYLKYLEAELKTNDTLCAETHYHCPEPSRPSYCGHSKNHFGKHHCKACDESF